MDTEVERVEEMLPTGLSDGADEVVEVATTTEAVRVTAVVLSVGRLGSAVGVGSVILRRGTEVGMVSSGSIASLV